MSEKMKLPREVAEAIDTELKGKDDERLSWAIHNMVTCHAHQLTDPAIVIKEYFGDGKWMLLMRALINGYEVEQTPEDKVREYVEQLKDIRDGKDSRPYERGRGAEYSGRIDSVMTTLNLLGVKISGVNAE